jgi:hypothetical protein
MEANISQTLARIMGQLWQPGLDLALYDHQNSSALRMGSRRIGSQDIEIYDLEMRHYVTGSMEHNQWVFYDHQRDDLLNIDWNGNTFQCYDFDSGHFYRASIRDKRLEIIDLETTERFEFTLQSEQSFSKN